MANRRVLNSWKEISQYVGRGVRTIQRYERTYSFPVRRIAGRTRTSVMAFSDEIDAWLTRSALGFAVLNNNGHADTESSSEVNSENSLAKIPLQAADSQTIWLIEDEASHVQEFKAALARVGPYEVTVFSSSSVALKAIMDVEHGKVRPPALIVLDYELSGSTGFEVLTHYRGSAQLKSVVPLIVWSVLDNVTSREMSMWMGAKTFVAKQVGERVLTRTLALVLSGSGPGKQQAESARLM
jgi:PleD family two-component response regulator